MIGSPMGIEWISTYRGPRNGIWQSGHWWLPVVTGTSDPASGHLLADAFGPLVSAIAALSSSDYLSLHPKGSGMEETTWKPFSAEGILWKDLL